MKIRDLGCVALLVATTSARGQEPTIQPPFVGTTGKSGKLNSPFGPRNPGPVGSRLHGGVDYNLAPENKDRGTLIPAFLKGVVRSIIVEGTAGHSLVVASGGNTFQLLHLFCDRSGPFDATCAKSGDDYVVKSASYDVVLTRMSVKSVDPRARPKTAEMCPYILFLQPGTTSVKYAYTESRCASRTVVRGKYGVFRATSKVDGDAFPWLAPLGDSGIAKGIAHLHVQVPAAGEGRKLNPLLFLDHDRSVGDPPYNITRADGGKRLTASDKSLLLRIDFSPDLDLDFVKIELPAAFQGALTNWKQSVEWRFGGTPQEPGNIVESELLLRDIGGCSAASATKESVCAEPWNVTNVDGGGPRKALFFYSPIDLSTACSGSYPVRITANSVNRSYATQELDVNVDGTSDCPIVLNVTSTLSGWSGLPVRIQLGGLYPTNKDDFASRGDTGSTCGSERGTPLFSAQVDAGADFFGVTSVTGMPQLDGGPFINRRPCSSFVASKRDSLGTVWINATGRGFRISTVEFDWEYQLRYFSGTPAAGYADRTCVLGVVPNSGFFLSSGTMTCSVECDPRLGKLPSNDPPCN